MTTPTPFVRQYNPSHDFQGGLGVFLSTIDASLDWEPARTIGAYLWYIPYVTLAPSTCVFLDAGDGKIVGYCIGTADTAAFARRWRDEFVQILDDKIVPRPGVETGDAQMEKEVVKGLRKAVWGAECSMLLGEEDEEDKLERWSGHLHVNVLSRWQRSGWGRMLVNAFCDKMKREGKRGVHLDVGVTNAEARAFYKVLGFEELGKVVNKEEAAVTLVKRIEF